MSTLTIPTLIQKYREKVVVTRLKTSESQITQMLNMAQAEYGDPNEWGFNNIIGSSGANAQYIVKSIAEKYFLPYLNNTTKHEYTNLKSIGYRTPYKLANNKENNSYLNSLTKDFYIINFANGSSLIIHIDGHTDENGFYLTKLLLFIDVNGIKQPNTFGKDTFIGDINSHTGRFEWYSWGVNRTRNDKLIRCKNYSFQCGPLIQNDNYEIKKDYPYKI